MDVDHAAGAVGGDNHEAVMLAWLMLLIRVLADGGAQYRRLIPAPDQVGLLLRSTFVDPLKPIVDRDYCAVWPDCVKEWAVGDFLHSGIDRRRVIPGPVRAPPPADHVGVQELAFLVEKGELSGRRGVVPLKGLLTGRIDQGVLHAQRRHEVVNAAVLGKSSAHC